MIWRKSVAPAAGMTAIRGSVSMGGHAIAHTQQITKIPVNTGKKGTNVKTKRMKKLLMAEGLSRNQVNRMVREQRAEGSPKVSNAVYFHVFKKDVKLFASNGMLPYMSSFVLLDKEPEDGQEEPGKSGGEIPEES